MTSYAKTVSKKVTPQSEKASEKQVKNNAGGYVFSLSIWDQLDRFLILGCEGNTFYATERKMTKDNTRAIEACLKEDGPRTVRRIVEVSQGGNAPKNDPAVFALAVASAAGDDETRKLALDAIVKVCRIGTDLFSYVADVGELRGWGKGLCRAVGNWYTEKTDNALGYQLMKYQNRNGWSHRDVLRLSHAKPKTPGQEAMFRYLAKGVDGVSLVREVDRKGVKTSYAALDASALPKIFEGKLRAQEERDPKVVAKLITEYGLTHEMVPNEVKKEKVVWDALLQKMPMHAMVRNLGRMSSIELLTPLSAASKKIITQLGDQDAIQKSRLHPIAVLKALFTYQNGQGDKGKLTWRPVPAVVAALEGAFYLAFKNIEPTGKNILLAIDISGSMEGGEVAGVRGLTPRIAAGAMAMATMRSEKNWHVVGYTSSGNGWTNRDFGVTPIDIKPTMTLKQVCATMAKLPMGGTDCALPILYAQKEKMDVDAFISYTDNETWAGDIHPHQALKQYRQKVGKMSKLIAVGMVATEYSVVDPSDPGSMNVAGFSTDAPAVMANFVRGKSENPLLNEDPEER